MNLDPHDSSPPDKDKQWTPDERNPYYRTVCTDAPKYPRQPVFPKTTLERLGSISCWEAGTSDYSEENLWRSALHRINNDWCLFIATLLQIGFVVLPLMTVTVFASLDPLVYAVFILPVIQLTWVLIAARTAYIEFGSWSVWRLIRTTFLISPFVVLPGFIIANFLAWMTSVTTSLSVPGGDGASFTSGRFFHYGVATIGMRPGSITSNMNQFSHMVHDRRSDLLDTISDNDIDRYDYIAGGLPLAVAIELLLYYQLRDYSYPAAVFLPCALILWAAIHVAWVARKKWRNERLFIMPAAILSVSAIIAHIFISDLAAVSSSVFLVALIAVLVVCVRASSIGMVWFIMMMARYDRDPDERREPPADITTLPGARIGGLLQILVLVAFLTILYLAKVAHHG